MRYLSTLLAFALCVVVALAVPEPPAMPKPMEPPPVGTKLRLGPTIWGQLTRDGNFLHFRGHDEWSGEGEILPSGDVRILWTWLATNEICPGMYRINEDGILVGQWGNAGECKIEPDNTMSGIVQHDIILEPGETDPNDPTRCPA